MRAIYVRSVLLLAWLVAFALIEAVVQQSGENPAPLPVHGIGGPGARG